MKGLITLTSGEEMPVPSPVMSSLIQLYTRGWVNRMDIVKGGMHTIL